MQHDECQGGHQFAADAMLGTLTRYLRFSGFDCLFFRTGIIRILNLSIISPRILLTRDSRVISAAADLPPLAVYDPGTNDPVQQYRRVMNMFDLWKEIAPRSRCLQCNGELNPVPRQSAAGNVPDYVFHQSDEFFACRECGRIYWPGTHAENLRRRLNHQTS